MGRTIPSFRMAEAQEVVEWKAFRRSLSKQDRVVFDSMLDMAKLYASASSAALRTSRFEGMAMAMIFHHYRTLAHSMKGITRIRQDDGEEKRLTLFDAEIIEELDSWRRFAGALRAEDRELFDEMLKLCYEYFPAIQAKGTPYLSDALFMSLLLIQHKTITRLAGEVEKMKAERGAGLAT